MSVVNGLRPNVVSFAAPRAPIGGAETASFKSALVSSLIHAIGKDPATASPKDWYYALAYLVRGAMSERLIATERRRVAKRARRVHYMSMEYLLGRSLVKSLLDLDMLGDAEAALADLGHSLGDIAALEPDPGLGNGGLGRLAACFLESMATSHIAGAGYGIRFEFGTFSQVIKDGVQVELPDNWLRERCPWEFPRPEASYIVRFGGRVLPTGTEGECGPRRWVDGQCVVATASDFPVTGFRNGEATQLRLWSARATEDIDLGHFNRGDYIAAVADKIMCKTLSRVLYPDDSTREGRELRLKQEYFFVAASLQDIIAKHLAAGETMATLADQHIVQLNDTHPALAVAELMRLLVDEHGFDWDAAWDQTRRAFAYTNHTLMSEALERWPVDLVRTLLPRHLEIIFAINERFLRLVREIAPGDQVATYATSLVEDRDHSVRMAHLAIVASERVNGVARLHSDLLRSQVFPEFVKLFPDKFVNVTNGVTPRRWVVQANPGLTALLSESIGESWMTDLAGIAKLAPFADDAAFRERFAAIKAANKRRLAALIASRCGVDVPHEAMFDVQVKRIHEYKRQLLNVLHVVTLYNRIRDGRLPASPRVVVLAGKAAPAYHMAKLVIRLVHDVAKLVNNDPVARDWLKVVFVPDYSIALAETIIPGADLSEQISTAGTEASGTGNMKFALNGALTIGTWDGANIEIANAVGLDNICIFGLRAEDVASLRASGYSSRRIYEGDAELARVLDMIGSGAFSPDEPTRYRGITMSLLDGGDHYMLLADYATYVAAQESMAARYLDCDAWMRTAILNVAGMGYFSSDRAIAEYASNIWHVSPQT